MLYEVITNTHTVFLPFLSRYRKNGTPINAVITPTGISFLYSRILDIVSEIRRKTLPEKNDAIRSFL